MMDIEDFIDWLREQLDMFMRYYKRHHNDYPKDWPVHMNAPDWMEQFTVWLETEQPA